MVIQMKFFAASSVEERCAQLTVRAICQDRLAFEIRALNIVQRRDFSGHVPSGVRGLVFASLGRSADMMTGVDEMDWLVCI